MQTGFETGFGWVSVASRYSGHRVKQGKFGLEIVVWGNYELLRVTVGSLVPEHSPSLPPLLLPPSPGLLPCPAAKAFLN